MKRFLLILILVAGLAAPATATANYSLITSDGGTTLVLGAGNEPAVAVTYSVVCAGTCATIISSANGVTGITDGAGCSGSGVTVTCDPSPQRVRVNGTGAEDLVTGACTGATVPLLFTGGGANDEVNAPTCRGSAVDLGDGDDRALANGITTGGPGNDTLRGGSDNDTLDGGPGRDLLIGGPGADLMRGGTGVDTASFEDRGVGTAITVTINDLPDDGQTGGDNVATDVENITGGKGNDRLFGNAASNVIDGSDGNDSIDPGAGIDVVDGGPGDDRITARDGTPDVLTCGDGADSVVVDAFDTVEDCESVDASRDLMPDVDADGVPAPADCADRDASRRPGFRDKPGNGVDEDCAAGDAPFARVLSSVQNLFTFGRVTRFQVLKVRGVPEHATVELRCSGGKKKGCFSGVKRFRFPRGKDTANIRRPIRRTKFRAGSRLELRILAPESIGKVVRFSIRRNKPPKQSTLCIAPGARSPSRCR